MRDGSVAALWLDHRGLSTPGSGSMNHAEHQHVPTGENKTDGVRRAQLSQLFFANLANADSAHSIARGVCYCCKTAMATDLAGAIYAAWRQVYEGNIRDIAFTKSADGGRTFSPPVRVSEDNWVLDGCPENGPAIAVEARGTDSRRMANTRSRSNTVQSADAGAFLCDLGRRPSLHGASTDSYPGCPSSSADSR